MEELSIELFNSLCANDVIKWTSHVLSRMRERKITSDSVISTMSSGKIIKQYHDDKPYPSCLIYNNKNENPVHVVASSDGINIYVITAYIPTLEEWEPDFQTRKENL